jgi:ubiquinone/menaquinone biosynthesis C-methylase UbiE
VELSASLEIALDPGSAFDVVVDELRLALERNGLTLDEDRLCEGDVEVGEVVAWERGSRIALRWWPAPWQPDVVTDVELRFEEIGRSTRVTLAHSGWAQAVGDGTNELAGWFAGEVLAPLLRATAPIAFGDWLTDRAARRPSGAQAREVYRNPLYHFPNFAVLLAELALGSDDYLLEVGCGGGAFLHRALESGCRAAAVDHSADMVRLAREVNEKAVAAGRLEVVRAGADALPFGDDRFTAAAMTGVLGFIPDPVAAFREMHRTLRAGGRLAVLGADPELRGTVAAPEPMASRLRFYDSAQLEQLARDAGFTEAHVEQRTLGREAEEAGIREEHLELFTAGPGARFLFATK